MTAETTTYQSETMAASVSEPVADPMPNPPEEESTRQNNGGHTQRPDGITLVAGYHFLIGTLLLLGTCGMAIPTIITGIVGFVEDPEALIATGILGVIGTIIMALSIVYLSTGYGLWTQRQWARTAAMALGVVSLFGVPIGTIIGGLILWYLMKPEVSLSFE